MPRHENWTDEPQGKVPHGRAYSKSDRYEREHYHAPMAWEHETGGRLFTAADREEAQRMQMERELISQQWEENRCAMI